MDTTDRTRTGAKLTPADTGDLLAGVHREEAAADRWRARADAADAAGDVRRWAFLGGLAAHHGRRADAMFRRYAAGVTARTAWAWGPDLGPFRFSADPAAEAAVGEARACLWPCSDAYKADMGRLADREDRVAAIMAGAAEVAETLVLAAAGRA